jgi:integrase
MIDIDSLPWDGDINDQQAMLSYAIQQLLAEFQAVDCWYHFSSSMGIKSGIRVHLWFWLERPCSDDEMKAWLSGCPVDLRSSTTEPCITLSEALETYVTQKGAGKPKTFKAAAQRACTYLVDACGAKNLAEYSRADALSFRDYLIAKGLVGSSVGRVISSIRAVFNFAISEYALDLKNPFVGMYFDKTAGVSKRLPIPIDDIRKVQHLCRKIDDDLRWLVALVSDMGMRLAEGAGLLKRDTILDADIPI